MCAAKGNVIVLSKYLHGLENGQMRREHDRYPCKLSGNRLEGNCELLIYNPYQRTAELFFLWFSPNGATTVQYLQEEEVMLWFVRHTACEISYAQAMLLLGDAVRRLYRERGAGNPLCETHDSIHVQRAWQGAYDSAEERSLAWLLCEESFVSFIKCYFQAINNKDAVLLYDMMAEAARPLQTRELYAYNWNHVLEEVTIVDFAVAERKKIPGEQRWEYYLILCGQTAEGTLLSVDVCLHLVRENGYVRLWEEQVLEASHIAKCCYDMEREARRERKK